MRGRMLQVLTIALLCQVIVIEEGEVILLKERDTAEIIGKTALITIEISTALNTILTILSILTNLAS